MLQRVLEPEVMDTPDDARDYDTMDHAEVNRAFVRDFFTFASEHLSPMLDVGTGTAQIPIEFCRQNANVEIVAIDLAQEMLNIATENVKQAGFAHRVRLELASGRAMPYETGTFPGVVSNSIIHHIPDPFECFSEMVRVCKTGGVLFVRDLVRPDHEVRLNHLVQTHAGKANDHQRQLFADSLRAALTLAEVRSLLVQLGFATETVTMTSDRHWTWAAICD